MINEASIDTTDMAADWGNWLLKNTKIENCFDTNLKKKKKPKRSASRLLHVYLLLQRHGGHSVTWPNSAYLRLWTAAVWGGAQNSRQLFALIVRSGSALLFVADTLLINGKCCIYILVLGTRQLLRWQGAQCWLRSVTNPKGFPFGLIVTNRIEKRLINLLIVWLSDKVGGIWGEVGAQGKRQKAQSFYDEFFSKDSG